MQSSVGVHMLSAEVVSFRNAVQIRKRAPKLQKMKAVSVLATETISPEEQAHQKRAKAHAKLKKLMSGRQTPLSEVAKPAAPSPFAPYSEMSEEEIAQEVERKRDELERRVDYDVPTVFHFGYYQSINMAPRKAKAGKKEAQKRIKAIMAGGSKTKVVVVKPDSPYKSAPTNLTPEMIEGIMTQLNKKTGANMTKSAGSPLEQAREASQERLRWLMSGKQTYVSEVTTAEADGAMPQYRNMTDADIKALVERTRVKVDRIIEEEKAEKVAERAARKAAAAKKAAATGERELPEGVTVVVKAGRAETATNGNGHQAASSSVSVDEAREAAQRRLRSLMASKQTPVSKVAKADDKGALLQYGKCSEAELALMLEKQKLKNATGVIVERRDEGAAAPFREGTSDSETQEQAELAQARGHIRAFMASESAEKEEL